MILKLTITLIALLMAGGMVLIFDLLNLDPKHQGTTEVKSIIDINFDQSTKSLKDMLSYYNEDRASPLTKEINKAQKILKLTRRTGEFKKTFVMCTVLGCVGAIIGFFMKNFIAVALLAAGMFMIPLWRLEIFYQKYQKYLTMQLESCVSLITTSYMRSNDIIASFEENIENISVFVRAPFEEFLAEYKINPNMKRCIRNLQSKIDETIFKEWCEVLIKSYENSGIKENLLAVTEKYSAVRRVQDDLDSETASAMVEYIVMLGMLVFIYPMVYMLNKEWFAYYSTLPGKICIGWSIFVGFLAIKKIIELSAPVQFKR